MCRFEDIDSGSSHKLVLFHPVSFRMYHHIALETSRVLHVFFSLSNWDSLFWFVTSAALLHGSRETLEQVMNNS